MDRDEHEGDEGDPGKGSAGAAHRRSLRRRAGARHGTAPGDGPPRSLLPCALYLVAVSAVVLSYLAHVAGGVQVWDFWAYCSYVREAAARPFSPENPFFAGGPPRIRHWPYAALLGAVSHASGREPVDVLSAAGALNLSAFAAVLPPFTRRFFGDAPYLPLLALGGLVFAWGAGPWVLSGVLAWDVLMLGASYPSVVGLVTALAGYVALDRFRKAEGAAGRAAASLYALLVVSTILVHPLPALFLAALSAGAALTYPGLRLYVLVVSAHAAAVAAAWYFPFAPLAGIVTDDGQLVDPNAASLYSKVLPRVWPAVPGLIFLSWHCVRRPEARPLLAAAAFCLALYAYGYASGGWNFGRALVYTTMIGQLSLAGWAARTAAGSPRVGAGLGYATAVLFAVAAWSAASAAGMRETPRERFAELAKVTGLLPRGATVLAGPDDSVLLPCLGLKIVAMPYPPLVPDDLPGRTAAVSRYFSPGADRAERAVISRTFGVTAVVAGRPPAVTSPDR